ncbi:hypothetical protein NHX12_000432 [Muraenolepis orangiensis]|uniref:Uncharacterized protein n=1 Tax=Muraenolepis orangiensis TaxID=630683 RepID=A0A9Q0D610_9TELE|nr:hypothetical protein NHX12_000432 [Muraenolepis orangiensis]
MGGSLAIQLPYDRKEGSSVSQEGMMNTTILYLICFLTKITKRPNAEERDGTERLVRLKPRDLVVMTPEVDALLPLLVPNESPELSSPPALVLKESLYTKRTSRLSHQEHGSMIMGVEHAS